LRILFASPIGGLGGAELFLLEMLEELRLRAPDWDLHLVAGSDGPLLARAQSLGVTCHLEPFPPELAAWGDSSAKTATGSAAGNALARWLKLGPAVLRYRRRLRALIRRIGPDLVHSNGLKFHALTGLAGCGEARLAWFMHDYLGSRRLLSRVLPWLARSVDLVWANSQSVADDIQKLLPSIPVEVLHCGIDLETFAPGPSEADWLEGQCEPIGNNSPALRIGLVATYARWKGQDLFLQAAAELLRRKPSQPVRFYIIGGPIYESAGSQFTRKELTQLASGFGIAEAVRFVPFQIEISRVYRSLDVVVHASRHPEPFGRTILEAMACGRAVIATEAGGAAEIFSADKAAVGVPPGDVCALSQAMKALVEDAELRSSLGHKARVRANEFSRGRMGEKLHSVYSRPALRREKSKLT